MVRFNYFDNLAAFISVRKFDIQMASKVLYQNQNFR